MINDVRVDTLETVPASGMVELDYVSPVRPKPDAEPLHPARLLRLVQRMRLVPRVRRAAKAPAVTQSEVDKRKYELGPKWCCCNRGLCMHSQSKPCDLPPPPERTRRTVHFASCVAVGCCTMCWGART